MNLQKMIAELQAERDRLDEAILALERLSVSNAPRRGSPARFPKEKMAGNSSENTPAAPDSDAATSPD